MSERYNVAASAVLGENYKITNIECSDYNPNIDNSITVTITVNDVYGDAISDESVTVTASEGNFTQLNGSNITNASSVTGTTNSSGQFTLTYACSVWGLISFTANNTTTQIKVGGYKSLSLTNGTLYYDDEKAMAVLNYHSTTTWNVSAWTSLGTIFANVPSGLRPSQYVFAITSDNRLIVRVKTDGNWEYTTSGNNIVGPYIYTTLTWFLP
jgi:hypothetical protein